MRTLFATVALAALVACSPPAQAPQQDTPAPAPTEIACNDVAPTLSRQVGVEEEVAIASAASDLRGGRIAPGTYDLTQAVRIGSATGWTNTRSVALEVTEAANGGVTFNWAGAAPDGAIDRWTADFTETPNASITYTCGRVGNVAAEFSATPDSLELRLPDGANGRLNLSFARRP